MSLTVDLPDELQAAKAQAKGLWVEQYVTQMVKKQYLEASAAPRSRLRREFAKSGRIAINDHYIYGVLKRMPSPEPLPTPFTGLPD